MEKGIETKHNEAHLAQLASVGQIAAGIAHEVKNPLTAVKGFLQLLREKNADPYIEIAQTELENALAVLQNLLQVSKPDQDEENFESIDLTVELELLIQLFQDQMYRIQLEKKFSHPGNYVYGIKNQLKKAFFNLLKNAFEAIPDNGTVVVGHEVADDKVIVYIEDTGVGIPEDKLRLLGTPFFTTKQNGTGMGLTLVYSVIYQHNGYIEVESGDQLGTRFTVTFPRETGSKKSKEVVRLNLQQSETNNLVDFFSKNRKAFEEHLLIEAVNVRDKIEEILEIGNINLLDNAYKLVIYIVEGKEHEVVSFARMEGMTWAKHSLTLSFKLEWIQAVRRVMWDFLYNFDLFGNPVAEKDQFFNLEKQINNLMDLFLNHLFMSYTQLKDDLIRSQRDMVDNLSVPIIPLTAATSILPLTGQIDDYRSNIIEDKVLSQIGTKRIETLIIDLSGVAEMDTEVIRQLIGVIDGIRMMGCQAVITGLRPEIVKVMIRSGLSFEDKAMMKGTLQQALADYLGVTATEEA